MLVNQIAYFSNVSENTHRFILKLAKRLPALKLYRIPLRGEAVELSEHSILITPTYGSARTTHVPPQVKKFLNTPTTRDNIIGVIGAGNLNFGEEYCVAGDIVARKLGVPLLHKFELSGLDRDLDAVEKVLSLSVEQLDTIMALRA